MNPAKYRHRVSVLKLESTRNPDGEWVNKWKEYKKIWASRKDKGGDEYFVAKASNAVRTVLWEIRFDQELYDFGEARRLLYRGQEFDIKDVADKRGTRAELEIVTEVVMNDE